MEGGAGRVNQQGSRPMLRDHVCYQHPQRPVVSACARCGRPFCRDCGLEMLGMHLCEGCKLKVATEIENKVVLPDANRALLMAALGLFAAGFVLGPYALWRASQAQRLLRWTPWLRGRWHIRAAFVLGGVATLQGVMFLVGRFAAGG